MEETDLLEENAHYAHVRLNNGIETTVSTKHLSKSTESIKTDDIVQPTPMYSTIQTQKPVQIESSVSTDQLAVPESIESSQNREISNLESPNDVPTIMSRRSTRISVPPKRLIEEL